MYLVTGSSITFIWPEVASRPRCCVYLFPFPFNTICQSITILFGNRKQVKTLEVTQESRAIARKSCDAAAVPCGLEFADIQYKFKSS